MKHMLSVVMLIPVMLPHVAVAAPLLACSGASSCNFCTLAQTVKNVGDFVMIVAILIGIMLMMYAGFRLTSSQGDVGATTEAKKMLWNVIIGIVIMMSAWFLVDTLIKAMTGSDFGVWNAVSQNCGGQTDSASAASVAINLDTFTVNLILPEPEESVYAVEGPESGGSGGYGYTPTVAGANGRANFTFSTSLNSAQQGHLSQKLAQFQACIANNVMGGEYVITSVSDNKIASGAKTWQQCAGGGCAHARGSCHYGGSKCVGSSYALDIRTSNLNGDQKSSFLSAAKACGGWGQNEGNHLHVSIGARAGCGCN